MGAERWRRAGNGAPLFFFIPQFFPQLGAIEQALRGLRCIFIAAAQRVGVYAQRDAGIGVAHARGDGHGVNVIRQQYGGMRMPQIVEAYPFKAVGMAQSLARAFGDGAERGRMKADLTLQEAMPPRGVAIISGEDTPGVGESGMARFYVVNVGKGDVPANESLTAMQELARLGYLQKSMRGYIVWLSKQVEKLPQMLHDAFIRSRAEALERTKGQHGRTAEGQSKPWTASWSGCTGWGWN